MPKHGSILASADVNSSSDQISVTPGATISIDVTLGNAAKWTAGQNETINLTGAQFIGQRLLLLIASDASIRTITFGTGFKANIALVTVASKLYVIEFISDGVAFLELARSVALT